MRHSGACERPARPLTGSRCRRFVHLADTLGAMANGTQPRGHAVTQRMAPLAQNLSA